MVSKSSKVSSHAPRRVRLDLPASLIYSGVRGFTLIEMLISLSMILAVSAFALMRFSESGKAEQARGEALRFGSVAREMQRRTLSGSLAPDAVPPLSDPGSGKVPNGGYGMLISADGKSFSTVASSSKEDNKMFLPQNLSTIATYTLPAGLSFAVQNIPLAPSGLIFLFTQPKGILCAQEASGARYCGLCREFDSTCVGGTAAGSSCSTNADCPGGGSCNAQCLSSIPLATNTQQLVTVLVQRSGSTLATLQLNLVSARLGAQ